MRRLWAATWPLDGSQVLVGLLLGIAVTARLPMIFAAPFFVARRRRRDPAAPRRCRRRSAGSCRSSALLGYTFLTTGAFLHPGYDYQYRLEVAGYPTLGYRADWSVEDPRYVPQNLGIMLGAFPAIAPGRPARHAGLSTPTVTLCTEPGAQSLAVRSETCPLAVPVDIGTSLLLTAPGLLLALFAIRRYGRVRLALGTAAAVLLIGLFNLAHFSQGWVQWGYRFSLDWLPFVLPMVALGAARPVGRPAAADRLRAPGRRRPREPVGRDLGPVPWLVARRSTGIAPAPPRGRRRPGWRRALAGLPDDAAARASAPGTPPRPRRSRGCSGRCTRRGSRPTSCWAGLPRWSSRRSASPRSG